MNRLRLISFRRAFVAGALLVQVLSCHPYQGYEGSHYDLTIPQPVHVFVGNPSAGVEVRSGMGTVDRLAQLEDKTIRVFAVNTRDGIRYDKEGGTALAPDFLLNGAVGRLSDSRVDWEGAMQYYYPNNGEYYHSYDFTACFLDDLYPLSVQRTADAVRYELRIDGWQDLMTSRAQAPDGYNFSYLSARTDVNPTFKMQHQMVKLRFELKPGVTAGATKRLRISDFELDTPIRGYLTVASRQGELAADFSQNEAQALRLITGKENGSFQYFDAVEMETITAPDQMSDDKIVPMGGVGAYLLVPPADSYQCQFFVNDLSSSLVSTDKVKSTLAFPSGAAFVRGNAYVVTFEVFGRNQVSVNIEMEDWVRFNDGQALEFDNEKM